MNSSMLIALLRKDLVLYFSNRFFAFITILALVAYAAIYFVMPDNVDETLQMALFAPDMPPDLLAELEEAGVILTEMPDAAALRDAIIAGDYEVGVVLPDNFVQNTALGQDATINLYFSANLPEEFKELYRVFFEEIGFTLSGRALNLNAHEEILGTDRSGEQIPYRDRMLPLFAIFVLMMEMMGLASLIASEVTSGTITALLITPLRVEGLFLAKGIFGVGLAFTQAAVLMAVTGGLQQEALLILTILLLGSLLVTGIGFLIASVTKDMMSVMGWGILTIMAMSLPAFTVLIPGLTTDWVKIIPSYYLINVVTQVVNYGWGWAEAGGDMLILLALALLFFALGVVVLRRKFQ